jgi:hypothetical protein
MAFAAVVLSPSSVEQYEKVRYELTLLLALMLWRTPFCLFIDQFQLSRKKALLAFESISLAARHCLVS